MDFIAEVKRKYPYLTIQDVNNIVNKAKMFYYSLKYPCEPFFHESQYPISDFIGEQWVLAACEELVERLGFSSSVGYRENGMNWSFDGAELSDRLVSLIKPTIGVIK